jgi:hypothetical protein
MYIVDGKRKRKIKKKKIKAPIPFHSVKTQQQAKNTFDFNKELKALD